MRQRRMSNLLTSVTRVAAVAFAAACGAADPVVAPIEPTTPVARHVASKLPTLRITTQGGAAITSREVYVPGTFILTDTLGGAPVEGGLEIRGRGNSTWTIMPKKPYRLRLTASAPMLGMPASRHWALLANYADKTLLRNDIAFELSRKMGFAYTPRSEFADVYLNGAYNGVYQIVEHVRIATDRVNIPELKVSDTSATAITGGYLLEVDELKGEDFCFNSVETPMVFCAKSPETLLDAAWAKQRAYITGYLRQTEVALFGADFKDPQRGYAAFLDVPSAVDYFLLNEAFKNVDGNLRRSTFLFKPRGGKLTFGPVWDYDITMGNVNYLGADRVDGWYVRYAPWFTRLFQDPVFEARVRARWKQLRDDGTIMRLLDYASERSNTLSRVQAQNFERWPILSTWVWPNRVVTGTYTGEMLALQDWMRQRIRWMDSQLLGS